MFLMDCFVSLNRLPRNDEINKSLRDLALSRRGVCCVATHASATSRLAITVHFFKTLG